MRLALFVAGVCLLGSACVSTSSGTEPGPSTPPQSSGPRTSVSVLARELHLSSDYQVSRNRVVLEGQPGCVVLYPETTVVLVNGHRLEGMGKTGRYGHDFTVKTSDARRIRTALAADAASPPSPPKPPGPDEPTADRAWRVRLTRTWQYIVIHHSATDTGSAASFDRGHRKRGWDGLGYHFVIGNGRGSGDGEIEVGHRWTRQKTGAHAGRPRPSVNLLNEKGIGICLVGNFNSRKPTRKQRESLHRLVNWLRSYCRIPADRVLVHRDVKGTECPGRHFPAQEFLAPRRDVPAAYR